MDGVDESKRATLKRFAAIGAVSPLARLSGDDAGDSDARDAILGYLSTTPGAHFSKLRDDLRLGTGESQHHLKRLERDGAVESVKDGDYRRYFPAGRFSAFERRAVGYLRRDTARGMVLALLRDPDATGKELADRLGVSRPTVSRYAKELESAGLLARDDGYALARPEELLVLVVRYADSFGDDAAALADDAADLVAYDPTE
ncbi:winged helix-turn-helix transcriptional regulator [Halosegnis marinus]|uniref:Winged helix-turn-helix transcriptional regulator n=1 Tax=Halosegnis marinus TaxID=3034023 RepID=A0ABD5ZQG6_9EURY|nr:winged helix-turn-helix transcriptional regulator [Halosegnis sp. DT85]